MALKYHWLATNLVQFKLHRFCALRNASSTRLKVTSRWFLSSTVVMSAFLSCHPPVPPTRYCLSVLPPACALQLKCTQCNIKQMWLHSNSHGTMMTDNGSLALVVHTQCDCGDCSAVNCRMGMNVPIGLLQLLCWLDMLHRGCMHRDLQNILRQPHCWIRHAGPHLNAPLLLWGSQHHCNGCNGWPWHSTVSERCINLTTL